MNSNKKDVSTPDSDPSHAPTVGGESPTKLPPYSYLDAISTESDQAGPDLTNTTNIPSDVPSNTPTPVSANTAPYPTLHPMDVF